MKNNLHVSREVICSALIVLLFGVVSSGMPFMSFAAEGINAQIPFEGILKDAKGKTLDGNHDMIFTIYDAAQGGNVLWTGTYTEANGNAVTVSDGEFRVLLGSGTGNALTLNFNDDSYYLGITIGTDPEMVPREHLGASGYAINADFLDGLHANEFLHTNSLMTISTTTASPLVTLRQFGSGDFMQMYDVSDNLLSYMNYSGRYFMSSIETFVDEPNIFGGALDVTSADSSSFGGDIIIADGSGLVLGGGNGIAVSQDSNMLSDLVLTPVGESIGDEVRIVTQGALSLIANMESSGTGGEQPSLIFNTDGLAQLINLSTNPADNPVLELSFIGGTEVTDGGLRVTDGGIEVTDYGIDITSGSMNVADNITVASLAGHGIADLVVDDTGMIVLSAPSDERLKHNIVTIHDALNTVLNLRGVKYEWKNTEKFGSQTEIGFIAQEVEPVLPEVVRDTGEYLSLNTKNITAVIVEAVKELYTRVEEYFARTERLEREVANLRAEIELLQQASGGSSAVTQTANVTPAPQQTTTPETTSTAKQGNTTEASSAESVTTTQDTAPLEPAVSSTGMDVTQ